METTWECSPQLPPQSLRRLLPGDPWRGAEFRTEPVLPKESPLHPRLSLLVLRLLPLASPVWCQSGYSQGLSPGHRRQIFTGRPGLACRRAALEAATAPTEGGMPRAPVQSQENFTSIISLSLHSPTRQVPLLAPFCGWSNSSSEK